MKKQNEKLKGKDEPSNVTVCPATKGKPKRNVSGGLSDQVPKKARSEKFAIVVKPMAAPTRCRILVTSFAMTGVVSLLVHSHRYVQVQDKMFGGNKSMALMQTMFEACAKAKNACKSKRCKKCEYDFSSSSNSE